MEKWDILNSAGEPTGETVVREANALKEGQYHLVVHIWVILIADSVLLTCCPPAPLER